jgi:glycosyltransferase involved in cell wall biosynthesis
MKISGATFVRNAVRFDYPVRESIMSILPICDEVVVNVGESEDGTLNLIRSISSERLRIVTSTWDEGLRSGGRILSDQTNVALSACSGDWVFYIQADEVVHERYLPGIRRQMERYLNIKKVEGLLFDFKHFYGSYSLVKDERGWYRREVRVIRNAIGVRSWRDAQGFRLDGQKLKVVPAGAEVFHYGWARDPAVMLSKQKNLDRYWHDDAWIEDRYAKGFSIEIKGVMPFTNSHPAVMQERIRSATWDRFADPDRLLRVRRPIGRRLFAFLDRIGEYRNYRLLNEGRLRDTTT